MKTMKTIKYKFAFQYNYDPENEEFIYSMFGVDKKSKVKKVFLRNKIKMLEEDLNCDLVTELKRLCENYIKNKYPNYATALKGGMFFGNICIYPKEFNYNG